MSFKCSLLNICNIKYNIEKIHVYGKVVKNSEMDPFLQTNCRITKEKTNLIIDLSLHLLNLLQKYFKRYFTSMYCNFNFHT